MRSACVAFLACLAAASPAAAQPFAVVFLNRETVQLVDLAGLERAAASPTYDYIMIVRPKPDHAGGRLSHLVERHEARCADGMARRRSMAAVIRGEPPEPPIAIEDDPWTPMQPGERDAVCTQAALRTVTSIEQARALMDEPPR